MFPTAPERNTVKRRSEFVPTTSNNFLSFNILLPTRRLATRPPEGGVGYPPQRLKFQAALSVLTTATESTMNVDTGAPITYSAV